MTRCSIHIPSQTTFALYVCGSDVVLNSTYVARLFLYSSANLEISGLSSTVTFSVGGLAAQ